MQSCAKTDIIGVKCKIICFTHEFISDDLKPKVIDKLLLHDIGYWLNHIQFKMNFFKFILGLH